jgi:hypothetical protein
MKRGKEDSKIKIFDTFNSRRVEVFEIEKREIYSKFTKSEVAQWLS